MSAKEATARIKINKLLEASGWRFFAEGNAPANICLEPNVTIKSSELDAYGNDFEKTSKGSSTACCSTQKASPSSSSKPNRRTRGVRRLPAARRKRLPHHRPRSQIGGQEPARRQGAGPQVREVPELPIRNSLQRQFALLLGLGARESVRHYILPYTGVNRRAKMTLWVPNIHVA